ncbi:MAG: T9SS type A sorting domain-containing protein [Lentimicrobium sp.]
MAVLIKTILITMFLLIASGTRLIYAQHRCLVIDTLTTMIDGEQSPYNQLMPGDTLLMEPGTREYAIFRNINGDSNFPVIIINKAGKVVIDTDHYFGISFRNCRFVRLTGSGDQKHFYGISIKRVQSGGGIGVGDGSSDIELDHVSIENCQGVGISAKTDPDCTFTNTREKFSQFNTIIHDNYIENVGYEGLYIGSTKYFGQNVHCCDKDTLLLPSLLNGVRIYSNIIKHTGWDGIQVSSASNDCQVYDNLVMFDSQAEYPNQMSGIIIGGGSKCDCYNNYISQGKGNGIENHGLGGYRIFNNIIVDAGRSFLPQDSSRMRHGIFVSDVTVETDSSFFILNNTIIRPKSDGIRFSSKKSKNNLLVSNLIVDPGNYDYYENGNTSFEGEDSYVMIPDADSDLIVSHNFFTRYIQAAGISDTDFTLLPGSPLIDAAYFFDCGVVADFYHQLRPGGISNDIGAFEFNPAYLDIESTESLSDCRPVIFPNPVSTKFTIRYISNIEAEVSIGIYNINGNRLINKFQTGAVGEEREISIMVDQLNPGIYIYQLNAGSYSVSGKFIKSE